MKLRNKRSGLVHLGEDTVSSGDPFWLYGCLPDPRTALHDASDSEVVPDETRLTCFNCRRIDDKSRAPVVAKPKQTKPSPPVRTTGFHVHEYNRAGLCRLCGGKR